MLRALFPVVRRLSSEACRVTSSLDSPLFQLKNVLLPSSYNCFKFGTLCSSVSLQQFPAICMHKPLPLLTSVRSVTKFSLKKGKRKTVKTVLKRFYRLHWGAWIRTIAGRNKRIWRKSGSARKRARLHVFCKGNQSWLLDKMVTNYWRKPKYYVDDPYNPYHVRQDFYTPKPKKSLHKDN